jgi:hypothetical protein
MFALSLVPAATEAAVLQATNSTASNGAALYLYTIAGIGAVVFIVSLISTLRLREDASDAR